MVKKVLLCSALLVVASMAFAQSQPMVVAPGVTRTVLQQIDYPGNGFQTISSMVEIAPGAMAALHTHPGLETAYVVEGEAIVSIQGQPDMHVKQGDSFEVPANTPHKVSNPSPDKTYKLLSTLVVERDKPLTSFVPK
jgi:quercetin dioxygenase-like cupin family protein